MHAASCYQPCIENGLINGSKCVEDLLHHQNAFILFTCVEDYMLDGPSNATCGDDEVSGGWGDIPSCTHGQFSIIDPYKPRTCIIELYHPGLHTTHVHATHVHANHVHTSHVHTRHVCTS